MHSTLLNFFIYIISSFFLNEIDLKNQPNIIYYISDDKDQIDHNIYGQDHLRNVKYSEMFHNDDGTIKTINTIIN